MSTRVIRSEKAISGITAVVLSLLLIGCSPTSEETADKPESAAAVAAATASEEEAEMTVVAEEASLVPADFEVPVLVETEDFKLVPLGPDLVKIDFEAYMSSIEHLQETFTRSTSWPHADISDADAMLDMETEQSRFNNRESFAYAVLTPDGTRERGCVYVRPSSKPGYDAVVRMWVTKDEFDAGFDEELYAWVTQWVASEWPFTQVAYPGRAIAWSEWDEMPDVVDEALLAQNLATAEGFIDAFYSFDPELLKSFLTETDETAARILYYQGWAEGGHYEVLNRAACVADSAELIHCAITVKDDPVQALKTGFDVTDTFHLTFAGPNIASIDTSSNDQPIYHEARAWVEENMPEVMEGPCKRTPDGGTPGDCARAMTEGYRIYYETVVAPAAGTD